jgi:glutaredoxin-like protein NrdH
MRTIKVPGKNNRHRVLMYAISTCGWCKRAKNFLRDNNIEYEYVDIDLCSHEDRERIREDIISRGGRLSYPTIIVDDRILITSFQEDKIREVLEI